MNDAKSLLASRTFWGAMIAILATVGKGFGIELGTEDQAQLVDHALTVVGVLGGLLAVYGRTKATKAIGKGSGKGGAVAGLVLLVCVPLFSGCAATRADGTGQPLPHEQALAACETLADSYDLAERTYMNLSAALQRQAETASGDELADLDAARQRLDRDVAPALDTARKALVVLRRVASTWAKAEQRPAEWGEVYAEAVAALGAVLQLVPGLLNSTVGG